MLRLVTVALAALALAPTAGADPVRFATFNASLNRNRAGQLITDLSTPGNLQARDAAEMIERPAGRPPDQRVRLRRGRDRPQPLPAKLPLGLPERRRADHLPLPLPGPVEHRHPVRLRPQQQRRSADRTTPRLRLLPRPVRMAVYSRYPIDTTGSAPSRIPLEGHARRHAARRSEHAGACGLVLAGRAERLPALVQKPLGPADPVGSKVVHFLVSHPTPPVFDGPEDRNGTPQHRRDPLLGRLHHPVRTGYIYDDADVAAGSSRGAVRHRRRPELRPA